MEEHLCTQLCTRCVYIDNLIHEIAFKRDQDFIRSEYFFRRSVCLEGVGDPLTFGYVYVGTVIALTVQTGCLTLCSRHTTRETCYIIEGILSVSHNNRSRAPALSLLFHVNDLLHFLSKALSAIRVGIIKKTEKFGIQNN